MKLPRRITDILSRKESFLDDLRNQMERSVIRLQSSLFEQAISEVIPRLDIREGQLLETANNYRLVSEIEKLYKTFDEQIIGKMFPQVNKGLEQIANLNKGLFAVTLTELPKRFDNVIEAAKRITDLRLGLRGGKMVRGGFLYSLFKGDPIDLQQYMSKAITGQVPVKEFITGIREMLTGSEEKTGQLERKFQRMAYDMYQQYDAAYNKNVADEFGMKYFAYQGGLIKDSRDFCVCKHGKIWSTEEAKEWSEWTPAKGQSAGEFPDGYEIKAKDIYAVPSYLGYPGYDPIVDRGGFNCRHQLSFIPDELAFKLRPELQNKI